jgi:hypothetical protein
VTAALLAVGAARSSAGATCRVVGPLPDSRCTPGRALADVTAKQVCTPGYAAKVRHVPESEKREVYRRYGILGRHHGSSYEVDHLVSLELGGSNDLSNLWPEAAKPVPGFHEKDALENVLHARVCDGSLTLHRAQTLIRTNWLAAYRRFVVP